MGDSTLVHGYVGVSNDRVDRTIDLTPDVSVDIAADGAIVGIETYGRLPDLRAIVEVLQVARIPKHVKGTRLE